MAQEQEVREARQAVEKQKSKENMLKLTQMRDRERERQRSMLHHEKNAHLGECIALQERNDSNHNDHDNDNNTITSDSDYDEEEEDDSAYESDHSDSDASHWKVGGGGGHDDDGDDDDGGDDIEGDGGGDGPRKRRIHTLTLEGPTGEHFQRFKAALSEALSKRSGDLYNAIHRTGQLSFPAPNPLVYRYGICGSKAGDSGGRSGLTIWETCQG